MCRGGMGVDGGGGLGAQVSGFSVEIQSADAVGTLLARELHAVLDAFDAIGFHCLNCMPYRGSDEDALVGQRR
jgi:hypothetical protein